MAKIVLFQHFLLKNLILPTNLSRFTFSDPFWYLTSSFFLGTKSHTFVLKLQFFQYRLWKATSKYQYSYPSSTDTNDIIGILLFTQCKCWVGTTACTVGKPLLSCHVSIVFEKFVYAGDFMVNYKQLLLVYFYKAQDVTSVTGIPVL